MSNQVIVRVLTQYTVTRVVVRNLGKAQDPELIYSDMPAGTNEHNAWDRVPRDFRDRAVYTAKVVGPKDGATMLMLRATFAEDIDWKALDVGMDALATEYGEPPVPGRLFGNLIHDARPFSEVTLTEAAD